MLIYERVQEDIKQAMRAREKERLTTLRLIANTVKMHAIDNKLELPVPDDVSIALLLKMVKQRQDAYTQFSDANRPELADNEKQQSDLIETYLPKPLSEAELTIKVEQLVEVNKMQGVKDLGKLMQYLRSEPAGTIDMAMASRIAKAKLI